MEQPRAPVVSWDVIDLEQQVSQSTLSTDAGAEDLVSGSQVDAAPSMISHARINWRPMRASRAGQRAEKASTAQGGAGAAVYDAVFGLIILIVCVPTMISYAAIVFRGERFDEYRPTLTKFMFLSAAIHQLTFTLLSSMPFAVGQVQDIGLIFLSQIAREVFDAAIAAGSTPHEALATVLVACAGATALTGVGVFVVGKLRLSCYVELLPLPVIGGYLGYIGYFCLAAGASLGTGLAIDGIQTWAQFFVLDAMLWGKLALSIAFALVLFFISKKIKHPAALPAVLLATPVIFYLGLLIAGIPLASARASSWIPQPEQHPTAGWQCFELYNGFHGIAWHVLPAQIVHVFLLFLVVAFGSVLDIAAIQVEQPKPLDSDAEMRMVGISNLVSGLGGGYTGSYIFSMTIFSQRQKVSSKMSGAIVCAGELLLFLLPIDILQFMPGFFIGGIMVLFGIEIMLDWLVYCRSKVSLREYFLVWFTLIVIMALGNLINGCAVAIGASACVFLFNYSQTPAFEIRQAPTSMLARPWAEMVALQAQRERKVCVHFHGYLFFGASLQISQRGLRLMQQLQATDVIMDFEQVVALDSTAAKAISTLVRSLQVQGMNIVFAAVGPQEKQMHRLLLQNGALPLEHEESTDNALGRIEVAADVGEALVRCEERLLRGSSTLATCSALKPLSSADDALGEIALMLGRFLAPLPHDQAREQEHEEDASPADDEEQLLGIAKRMEERSFAPGEVIMAEGGACDEVGLLLEGSATKSRWGERRVAKATQMYSPGCMMGVLDFQVSAARAEPISAGPEGCRMAVLSRAALEVLQREEPTQALLVHRAMLRNIALMTQVAASGDAIRNA